MVKSDVSNEAVDFDFLEAARDVKSQYYAHKQPSDSERLARGHVAVSLVIPEELSDDDIFDQLNQDFHDFGIDFLWLQDGFDRKTLHVIQLKDHAKLPASEQKDAIIKMVAEVSRLLRVDSPSSLDSRSVSRWRDLLELRDSGGVICFYLLLTGDQQTTLHDFAFVPDLPLEAEYAIVDRRGLLREMSRELSLIRTEVQLSWENKDFSDFEGNGVRVLNGYISAAEYVKKTQKWGQDLFQLNPRLFLETVRKGPNKSMLSTLDSQERDYFHLLNNGVTAVCDDITKLAKGSQEELLLDNFQVVNGCQTTQTLWRWATDNPDALSSVFVPLRIIRSKDLAPKISVSTNSQNAITFLDLQANSDVQRNIKQALEAQRSKPVFYENRRGSWEAAVKQKNDFLVKDWGPTKGNVFRRLTSRDLCQTLLAVAGQPYKSKENLGELIESSLMKHLLTSAWSSPHQISLVSDLFTYISRRELWSEETSESQFLNTGKFHLIYMVYKKWLVEEEELAIAKYSDDETCLTLLSAEASKRIRDDFVARIGNLPLVALRAIDTEYDLNDEVGPRVLLRNASHLTRIEKMFEQFAKFN